MGRKPQDRDMLFFQPMKWATAKKAQRCRPLCGLNHYFYIDPGACAPGFMLTPASQAV